jgi:hypothetical protein
VVASPLVSGSASVPEVLSSGALAGEVVAGDPVAVEVVGWDALVGDAVRAAADGEVSIGSSFERR